MQGEVSDNDDNRAPSAENAAAEVGTGYVFQISHLCYFPILYFTL
jgi:hypothetical protein